MECAEVFRRRAMLIKTIMKLFDFSVPKRACGHYYYAWLLAADKVQSIRGTHDTSLQGGRGEVGIAVVGGARAA